MTGSTSSQAPIVLSKLDRALLSTEVRSLRRAALADRLSRDFDGRISEVRPLAEGTLAFAFIAKVDGRPQFLKTYDGAHAGVRLEDEALILGQLYGEIVNARLLVDAGAQAWLAMNVLEHVEPPPAPPAIYRFLGDLRAGLAGIAPRLSSRPNCNVSTLLATARDATEFLVAANQIDCGLAKRINGLLAHLERELPSLETTLCHGDFGPRNLMAHRRAQVAIDWEDLHPGVVDYDYLYWLTFFRNRIYYREPLIGRLAMGAATARALLAMITAIKCRLGVEGAHAQALTLGVSDRIEEIIKIE